MRKPWDGWELDLLLQARPGELPALTRRLGRTVEGVRSKHARLCPFRRERYWTRSEEKVVKRLWRQGLPVATIALYMGRSAQSVAGKVRALRLPNRKEWRPWTPEEREAVLNPGEREIQDVAAEIGRGREAAYLVRMRG